MAGFPELEKKLAEIEAKENPGEMMEEAVATANRMRVGGTHSAASRCHSVVALAVC